MSLDLCINLCKAQWSSKQQIASATSQQWDESRKQFPSVWCISYLNTLSSDNDSIQSTLPHLHTNFSKHAFPHIDPFAQKTLPKRFLLNWRQQKTILLLPLPPPF